MRPSPALSIAFPAIVAAVLFPNLAHSSACAPLLSHKVETILGEKEDLCEYAGKVVLVVNTASYCGYTPQYKGLQALYDRYAQDGFEVLGFPCNQFGQQEPGTTDQIAAAPRGDSDLLRSRCAATANPQKPEAQM